MGDVASATPSINYGAGKFYRFVVYARRTGFADAVSGSRVFSINLQAPTIANPANNATFNTGTGNITYTWAKNNTNARYWLKVVETNSLNGTSIATVFEQDMGDVASATPNIAYGAGKFYRFVVIARKTGFTDAVSGSGVFSINQKLYAPTLSSPANNSTFDAGTGNITYSWTKNNANGFATYVLKVVETSGLNGNTISTLYEKNIGDVSSFTPSITYSAGKFYRYTVIAQKSGLTEAIANANIFSIRNNKPIPPSFSLTVKGNNILIEVTPSIVSSNSTLKTEIFRASSLSTNLTPPASAFKPITTNFDMGLGQGIYFYKVVQTLNGVSSESIKSVTINETAPKGVTVIVHGYNFDKKGGVRNPEWMRTMADAIGLRSGNGQMNATILEHNTSTGKWDFLKGSDNPNEEIILLYYWGAESDRNESGWAEAAGDNLFASIVGFSQLATNNVKSANLLNKPFHFICHSRGNLVALHTFMRFAGINKNIEHYTALDPHPANLITDDTQAPFVVKSTDKTMFYEILLPKNVLRADNYFRRSTYYEIDGDFNGVRFSGNNANNFELCNETLKNGGYAEGHSNVHMWYFGTINPNSNAYRDNGLLCIGQSLCNKEYQVSDNWYYKGLGTDICKSVQYNRYDVGYNRSRLGNGTITVPTVNTTSNLLKTNDFFNGNLELAGSDNIQGWELHGGKLRGTNMFGNDMYNNKVSLLRKLAFFTETFNNTVNHYKKATTNYKYVPNVSYIAFDLEVLRTSTNNTLQVKFDNTLIKEISLTKGVSRQVLSIPSTLKGTVCRVTFEIKQNDIFTEVYVDNIKFSNNTNGYRVEQPIGELQEFENIISLYPNPANGNEVYFTQPISFTLLNIQGQVLQTYEEAQSRLDVSSLKNGLYFIRTNEGKTIKLLIEK
jgi:hypothetical protein